MAEGKKTDRWIHEVLSRIDANAVAISVLTREMENANPGTADRVSKALEDIAKADATEIPERPAALRRLAKFISNER